LEGTSTQDGSDPNRQPTHEKPSRLKAARDEHPWVWVNEPQHGTAVQAIAAVVGSVAALFALIFSALAFVNTRKQVRIANDQTKLAREQFEREVKERQKEKTESRKRAVVLFEQRKAEEEANRPRFEITNDRGGGAFFITITNTGPTPALNLLVTSENGKDLGGMAVLRSGEVFKTAPTDHGGDSPVMVIRFRTIFSSVWRIRQNYVVNEEVQEVHRIYDLPSE
jgi:hypothetical protein